MFIYGQNPYIVIYVQNSLWLYIIIYFLIYDHILFIYNNR